MKRKLWAMYLVLLLIIMSSGSVIAHDDEDLNHMDDDHMTGWTGMHNMGIWLIFIWLSLAVVGVLVYYVMIKEDDRQTSHASSSVEVILDETYARGDLTSEEYLQMKRDIRRGS
jgi:uncharacterized membrane protein